jgi:hypothetical protein
MPDNKTKTAPEDATRINVHEDYEVATGRRSWV